MIIVVPTYPIPRPETNSRLAPQQLRVRAALAYFILRARARPWLQKIPWLGFTDDAAVLTAIFGLSSHITSGHRAAAARALGKEFPKTQ